MIGLESWPKPILQGSGSWLDSGQSGRWRPADHHCRSASSDSKGAGGKLVLKMTPKAEQSQPSAPERWEHPELYPLGDEGAGAMI